MKQRLLLVSAFLMASMSSFSDNKGLTTSVKSTNNQEVVWQDGSNVESFWNDYALSKGGLTWKLSASYPNYDDVKEGDTLLISVKQGVCLMEFFHGRWRRANDVRRWSDNMNGYGGCPFVFD